LRLCPIPWRSTHNGAAFFPATPACKVYTEGFLQLHMCIIYFFGGVSKCGRARLVEWSSVLWRALTRAPFDIVPPEILVRASFILPLAGILVCVMEASYPIFIWPRKTRFLWFARSFWDACRDRSTDGACTCLPA